jgi:tRNA (guanine9-N1)-methyltransferase
LSPDASEVLLEFDDETNFVIGGLIDRSVIRGASLAQSMECKLQARRLPIEEFCQEFFVLKKALSLNQVSELLLIYRETKNWKEAFE